MSSNALLEVIAQKQRKAEQEKAELLEKAKALHGKQKEFDEFVEVINHLTGDVNSKTKKGLMGSTTPLADKDDYPISKGDFLKLLKNLLDIYEKKKVCFQLLMHVY